MTLSDAAIMIVFVLFGLEVLARLGGWTFAQWRRFQDLSDWFEDEDEVEDPPAV